MHPGSTTSFDLLKVQESLRYVCDSFDWLTTGDNLFILDVTNVNLDTIDAMVTNVRKLLTRMSDVQTRLPRININSLPNEILANIFSHAKGIVFTPLHPRMDTTPLNTLLGCLSVRRVCKQWLRIINQHSLLWDTICLSLSYSALKLKGLNLSSLSLRHSGVVPLTVFLELVSRETVQWDEPRFRAVLAQMHRIRDLRLHIADRASGVLRLLSQSEAARLETLSVTTNSMVKPSEDSQPLFQGWRAAPHLQSLLVHKYTGWREGTFGKLRHLIISQQSFDLQAFRQLLDVLVGNPTLEDLVVYSSDLLAHGEQDIEEKIRRFPSVHLPNLLRLRIGDTQPEGYMLLLSTKMTLLPGCSQVYEPVGALRSVTHPPSFKPRRLFINGNSAIETDLMSAILVRAQPLTQSMNAMSVTGITELWLGSVPRYSTGQWSPVFSAMANVARVVIIQDITFWLETIGSACFPLLAELQLRSAQSSHGHLILDILMRRKDLGRQLKSLQFVRPASETEVDDDSVVTFNAWTRNAVIFRMLVDSVSFNSREDIQLDFRLPAICRYSSPVHSFWQPWLTVRG